MLRTVFVIVSAALGATVALAQDTPLQQRNAAMKSIWADGFRSIAFMVRGREPYDQAKVDAGFAKLGELAGKLPPLWPAGSQGVAPNANFTSTAKVWENKADFEAKLAAFTKAVADNKGKAKNLDQLKPVFEAVNKTCDDCHETYRARVQR